MNGNAKKRLVYKTIAVVDLSRYADIANQLDQQLGPQAVADLEDQIRRLVHEALKTAAVDPTMVPYESTGDGAIIGFDEPDAAAIFAEQLHRVAEIHNRAASIVLAERHFRVGIASDTVLLTSSTDDDSLSVTGTAISKAVRLEGACQTGEIVVCSETWADLSRNLRKAYRPEETVEGKREERFRVHRRRVVAAAPWETPSVQAPTDPTFPTDVAAEPPPMLPSVQRAGVLGIGLLLLLVSSFIAYN